jgi:hypothetical protein
MIAEFLNRQMVLDQLINLCDDLRGRGQPPSVPDTQFISDTELLKELDQAETRERHSSSGQSGYDPPDTERRGAEAAPLDDYAFISRDPIISLLQSALEEYYSHEHPEEIVTAPPSDDERRRPGDDIVVSDIRLKNAPLPRRTPDGRRVFDKFSITDIRWVQSKIAEGIRAFRGKHALNTTAVPRCEMPERVRLVIVGDWGSGLPRARKVANEMRKIIADGNANGLAQHVIHLGDVYYSGWAREYNEYVLPYWPVTPGEAGIIGSWSANGNHDMYSGGHGYFDVLLADERFHRQAQSSFFSFINKHWKILGLDTAWENASLCDPQPSWIEDEIGQESRRIMFLSHHQPFSAYENGEKKLVDKVSPILERHPIDAWFWGHEHRCMLYKPFANVQYGRCIGHGGIPVYMWHKESDNYPEPGAYEYRAYYQKGLERWALFGFTVLDFDGPNLTVRYIDENGYQHKTEVLA